LAHLDMEMAEDAATALARPPSKLNGGSLVKDSHDRWCEARSDMRRGSLPFDGVSSSEGSTMAAMLSMGNDHFSTRGLEEDMQRKVASEQTVFLRAWLPEFREAQTHSQKVLHTGSCCIEQMDQGTDFLRMCV
jgi:hypothetical protein